MKTVNIFDPAKTPKANEYGYFWHPDLEILFPAEYSELDCGRKVAGLLGFELDWLDLDMEDEGIGSPNEWNPSKGDGWQLVAIFDNTDEYRAYFVRPMIPEEQKHPGSGLKRYTCTQDRLHYELGIAEMEEDDSGEWVKLSDVEALLPRVWTAETIWGAPDGFYQAGFGDEWLDGYSKKEYWTGRLSRKFAPWPAHTRFFGPIVIPQPPASKEEAE